MKSEITKVLVVITVFYAIRFFVLWTQNVNNNLSIKVLDVGQGDAILINSGNSGSMLIDGGDNWDVDWYLSKQFVFPRCNINALVVTHPHADHLYGINRILKRCKPNLVTFNDVYYSSKLSEVFLENIQHLSSDKKITNFNFAHLKSGDTFYFGKVKFIVLWPDETFLKNATYLNNINDISTVLLLDAGKFEALFTGDLSGEIFSKIDKELYKKHIDGDLEILKVPHHGSADGRNIDFYRSLSPRYCVISVGLDNRYNHPDKTQIEELKQIGCSVLRTDEVGTIEFNLSGVL